MSAEPEKIPSIDDPTGSGNDDNDGVNNNDDNDNNDDSAHGAVGPTGSTNNSDNDDNNNNNNSNNDDSDSNDDAIKIDLSALQEFEGVKITTVMGILTVVIKVGAVVAQEGVSQDIIEQLIPLVIDELVKMGSLDAEQGDKFKTSSSEGT